ncbi:MAG: hypothetical protein LV481_15710 [Methylacidiphilales bacterium]|nr:hypothetical protein [Candidatus Methylacidiphilales bacterium]
MRALFIPILCSAALASLEAQESSSSSSPQPTPPYLAPVPENCHWIVNFSYVPKNAPGTSPVPPPAAYPVSVETIKVGNLRRILVKFVNSPPQQFDLISGYCFFQGPTGLEYHRLREDYVPYMFFDLGFSFTQCVNLASFKEYTKYQNVPAFHYQNSSTETWIAVDTMLPIGADLVNYVKTRYQYLPTPDSNEIVLTPEEQKVLHDWQVAEEIAKKLR